MADPPTGNGNAPVPEVEENESSSGARRRVGGPGTNVVRRRRRSNLKVNIEMKTPVAPPKRKAVDKRPKSNGKDAAAKVVSSCESEPETGPSSPVSLRVSKI